MPGCFDSRFHHFVVESLVSVQKQISPFLDPFPSLYEVTFSADTRRRVSPASYSRFASSRAACFWAQALGLPLPSLLASWCKKGSCSRPHQEGLGASNRLFQPIKQTPPRIPERPHLKHCMVRLVLQVTSF